MSAGNAQQQRQTLDTIVQSEGRAGKIERLVVMLESLSLTGCGDAFAVVKVHASSLQNTLCTALEHCTRRNRPLRIPILRVSSLQDPTTASMGAGIDRKVLQSFQRLDPGTVLILDKVRPPKPALRCVNVHVSPPSR